MATITRQPGDHIDTGRQHACTLGIGDRYNTTDLDGNRHEVTVSYATENLDDSNSIWHQRADAVSHKRHGYAARVTVTYRAPRCPHGTDWNWCDRLPCIDCAWPEEIETAYMGDAPARHS